MGINARRRIGGEIADIVRAEARTHRTLLDDLPAHVDPCGENGEFHTCVSAGPMFANPLELEAGEVVTREPFVWTDLELRHA